MSVFATISLANRYGRASLAIFSRWNVVSVVFRVRSVQFCFGHGDGFAQGAADNRNKYVKPPKSNSFFFVQFRALENIIWHCLFPAYGVQIYFFFVESSEILNQLETYMPQKDSSGQPGKIKDKFLKVLLVDSHERMSVTMCGVARVLLASFCDQSKFASKNSSCKHSVRLNRV